MNILSRNSVGIERLCGPLLNSWLEKISLFYIFIHSFLFVGGWTKLYIAIPACILLIIGACLSGKPEKNIEGAKKELYFPPAVLVSVFFLVVIIVFLSGIGGYAHQHGEYRKHNALLLELIESDWPLGFSNLGPENKTYALVTYMGYYLPAAIVGKVLGWSVACHFTFLWAVLGIYLTVLWFLKLVGKASFWFALLFLFFGGLDIIGHTLLYGWPQNAVDFPGGHVLDVWLIFSSTIRGFHWIFPSNMVQLHCGPHHILPNWLILLMVLYRVFYKRSSRDILFLWAAASVGSVFFFLGMTPYILLSLWTTKCRKLFSFQNIAAAPILLLIVGLFIISNNGEYPHGWAWQYHDLTKAWPVLLLFCGLEFGIYAAFCPRITHPDPVSSQRCWFRAMIVVLISCTMYRLGTYGDFTTKTALPSLIVLVMFLAAAINSARTPTEQMCAHILKFLLALGAVSGLFVISQAIEYRVDLKPPSYSEVERLEHLGERHFPVFRQLLADPNDSFFWKYMAPKLETGNPADQIQENR
ncbi:MAG: hypothetical protein DRP66_01895 [Planctomycetota bacterium]|nr:MAG: hypothetical protein DRP66_01895 [Planctomycetota bacterium]